MKDDPSKDYNEGDEEHSEFSGEHEDSDFDSDEDEDLESGLTPPERPLECGECKKPIQVIYSEIIGNNITRTGMCNDCPVLRRRLHGEAKYPSGAGDLEGETGVVCGNCGTTLDGIRMGAPLGCSACYEVFEEEIFRELLEANKIPPHLTTHRKADSLHAGRIPGEKQEISPSIRLLALNEALTETLKREDYEQAALLRDQIKALTEKAEKKKDGE